MFRQYLIMMRTAIQATIILCLANHCPGIRSRINKIINEEFSIYLDESNDNNMGHAPIAEIEADAPGPVALGEPNEEA